MGLSEDIKQAIAPYIGENLDSVTIGKIRGIITDIANSYGSKAPVNVEIILGQTQAYFSLRIMVDTYQQQIDELKARAAALETQSTGFAAAIANLKIGTDVQAWDEQLDAISDIVLSYNLVFGTDAHGKIAAFDRQSRPVGSVILLPYDPLSAGWKVSVTNDTLYSDPTGGQWYLPNGTGVSKALSPAFAFEKLFLALWGTAAYSISPGSKGANAKADWDAGKILSIPDMRGRAIASQGTVVATNRFVGTVWGSELANLEINNLPAHNHRISVTNITASNIAGLSSTGLGVISNGNATVSTIQQSIAGNRANNGDGLGAIADSTGKGASFAILNPTKAYFELWWLDFFLY